MASSSRMYLFVVEAVVCLLCVVTEVSCGQQEDRYGVLLDAGSSGTKVKVYKWQKPKSYTVIPTMTLLHGSKERPGIVRAGDLTEYINRTVTKAKEFVPEEMQSITPIYLMATAGARLLEARLAVKLLSRVRNVLSNTTINPFRFSMKNVRILSGEEEGVFAWIAANVLAGFFDFVKPASESVGVLEMGGGSTQIAFIPSTPILAGEFQVFLGGRRFDLYAHSYLYYGSSYIKERVRKVLVKQSSGSRVVANPCRLNGDQEQSFMMDGRNITFHGTSNPDACADTLKHFLPKAKPEECYPKPCSIGRVYQPEVGNMSFYAIQSFAYTPKKMNALDSSRHLNLTHLEITAEQYCQMDLAGVLSEFKVDKKYASDECLMGLYIPKLLQAYNMHNNTTIIVSNSINSTRIDWTMGAMLYELSQSPRLTPCYTLLPPPPEESKSFPNGVLSVGLTFTLLVTSLCVTTFLTPAWFELQLLFFDMSYSWMSN